ncbi:PHD finger protein enhancer of yellow 3 isoform X2 [Lycorma delicatula]|uniref:PHD finger protein enhancer of yellow 3 isoform X2 n=1 Tax=Lycorma delicatula TaxID=130591 RepID=UPI003F50D93A
MDQEGKEILLSVGDIPLPSETISTKAIDIPLPSDIAPTKAIDIPLPSEIVPTKASDIPLPVVTISPIASDIPLPPETVPTKPIDIPLPSDKASTKPTDNGEDIKLSVKSESQSLSSKEKIPDSFKILVSEIVQSTSVDTEKHLVLNESSEIAQPSKSSDKMGMKSSKEDRSKLSEPDETVKSTVSASLDASVCKPVHAVHTKNLGVKAVTASEKDFSKVIVDKEPVVKKSTESVKKLDSEKTDKPLQGIVDNDVQRSSEISCLLPGTSKLSDSKISVKTATQTKTVKSALQMLKETYDEENLSSEDDLNEDESKEEILELKFSPVSQAETEKESDSEKSTCERSANESGTNKDVSNKLNKNENSGISQIDTNVSNDKISKINPEKTIKESPLPSLLSLPLSSLLNSVEKSNSSVDTVNIDNEKLCKTQNLPVTSDMLQTVIVTDKVVSDDKIACEESVKTAKSDLIVEKNDVENEIGVGSVKILSTLSKDVVRKKIAESVVKESGIEVKEKVNKSTTSFSSPTSGKNLCGVISKEKQFSDIHKEEKKEIVKSELTLNKPKPLEIKTNLEVQSVKVIDSSKKSAVVESEPEVHGCSKVIPSENDGNKINELLDIPKNEGNLSVAELNVSKQSDSVDGNIQSKSEALEKINEYPTVETSVVGIELVNMDLQNCKKSDLSHKVLAEKPESSGELKENENVVINKPVDKPSVSDTLKGDNKLQRSVSRIVSKERKDDTVLFEKQTMMLSYLEGSPEGVKLSLSRKKNVSDIEVKLSSKDHTDKNVNKESLKKSNLFITEKSCSVLKEKIDTGESELCQKPSLQTIVTKSSEFIENIDSITENDKSPNKLTITDGAKRVTEMDIVSEQSTVSESSSNELVGKSYVTCSVKNLSYKDKELILSISEKSEEECVSVLSLEQTKKSELGPVSTQKSVNIPQTQTLLLFSEYPSKSDDSNLSTSENKSANESSEIVCESVRLVSKKGKESELPDDKQSEKLLSRVHSEISKTENSGAKPSPVECKTEFHSESSSSEKILLNIKKQAISELADRNMKRDNLNLYPDVKMQSHQESSQDQKELQSVSQGYQTQQGLLVESDDNKNSQVNSEVIKVLEKVSDINVVKEFDNGDESSNSAAKFEEKITSEVMYTSNQKSDQSSVTVEPVSASSPSKQALKAEVGKTVTFLESYDRDLRKSKFKESLKKNTFEENRPNIETVAKSTKIESKEKSSSLVNKPSDHSVVKNNETSSEESATEVFKSAEDDEKIPTDNPKLKTSKMSSLIEEGASQSNIPPPICTKEIIPFMAGEQELVKESVNTSSKTPDVYKSENLSSCDEESHKGPKTDALVTAIKSDEIPSVDLKLKPDFILTDSLESSKPQKDLLKIDSSVIIKSDSKIYINKPIIQLDSHVSKIESCDSSAQIKIKDSPEPSKRIKLVRPVFTPKPIFDMNKQKSGEIEAFPSKLLAQTTVCTNEKSDLKDIKKTSQEKDATVKPVSKLASNKDEVVNQPAELSSNMKLVKESSQETIAINTEAEKVSTVAVKIVHESINKEASFKEIKPEAVEKEDSLSTVEIEKTHLEVDTEKPEIKHTNKETSESVKIHDSSKISVDSNSSKSDTTSSNLENLDKITGSMTEETKSTSPNVKPCHQLQISAIDITKSKSTDRKLTADASVKEFDFTESGKVALEVENADVQKINPEPVTTKVEAADINIPRVKTPDSPKRVKLIRPLSVPKKPIETVTSLQSLPESNLLREKLEEKRPEPAKVTKRKADDSLEKPAAKQQLLSIENVVSSAEESSNEQTKKIATDSVSYIHSSLKSQTTKPIINIITTPATSSKSDCNLMTTTSTANKPSSNLTISTKPVANLTTTTTPTTTTSTTTATDAKILTTVKKTVLLEQKEQCSPELIEGSTVTMYQEPLRKNIASSPISSQNKQLEYTLKIGKASTTMIPKEEKSEQDIKKVSNQSIVADKDTSVKVGEILRDSDVTITPIISQESLNSGKGVVNRSSSQSEFKLPDQSGQWKHLTDVNIVPVESGEKQKNEELAKTVEQKIKTEVEESAVLTTSSGVKFNIQSTPPKVLNALISESHNSSSDDIQFIKVVSTQNEPAPADPMNTLHLKQEMVRVDPPKRRRGRPRKIPLEARPPMDMHHMEMSSHMGEEYGGGLFPVPLFDMSESVFTTPGHHTLFPDQVVPMSGRPQRSCRGRVKLPVVRTRRPRGSSMAGRVGSSGRGRGRGYKRRFTDDEHIITIDNVEQEMMRNKIPGRRRLSGGSRMDDDDDDDESGDGRKESDDDDRKLTKAERTQKRKEERKLRLLEKKRMKIEAREKEKAAAIASALAEEETRMSAPEGSNRDGQEGLYGDLLEKRLSAEGDDEAPTPKRRREHYYCCICLEETPLKKLTSPLDHRSWTVLYEAAIVRQFEPILKLTEDITKEIPPTVLYHRNCRSEFTHKKTLAKLTESTVSEFQSSELQNSDQTGVTGSKEFTVDQIAEYQWPLQGGELFMIQEQISTYLGVKSFKRKYPDIKRRAVEMEERQWLCDNGLVSESMCDLGLTAVSSAEVLDIMFADFPEKYEEFRKHIREKQARELSSKQKAALCSLLDKKKLEQRTDSKQEAIQSAASWNSNLNKTRAEHRRCSLDLQSLVVHYPKTKGLKMCPTADQPRRISNYPVALIPGQFSDFYKSYTPDELRYFPLDTVIYGPMKPNERHGGGSDGSQTDSDDSSSSDDSSDTSSEGTQDTEGTCEEDDKDRVKERQMEEAHCKVCGGDKTRNKQDQPEVLIHCAQCTKSSHPTCIGLTVVMVPHIRRYDWQCTDCKTCIQCKDPADEDKMLFCDLCDRGYHIYCVGLRKVPIGRWHCQVCSVCNSCGTTDPGGPDWQHEYKKGEKNSRIYIQTLCGACSKMLANSWWSGVRK